MQILDWWPKLDRDTQAWLIAHNGEAVAPKVLARIVAAGNSTTSNAWWVGEDGPDGFFLSDEAVDWIEATANDDPE